MLGELLRGSARGLLAFAIEEEEVVDISHVLLAMMKISANMDYPTANSRYREGRHAQAQALRRDREGWHKLKLSNVCCTDCVHDTSTQ